MPFTFAHPVAVLPFLKKKYFSATALIVGSIAPDFEYFFKMKSGGEHSHTLAGMFYFDLPVCFLLAWVFHQIIKNAFLDNLPEFVQKRTHELRALNFLKYLQQHYWVFVYSALLGIATHLLWDSFTHAGGFMVKQLDFLAKTKIHHQGVYYPIWYVLQIGCSYVGLGILLTYFLSIKPIDYKASVIRWPFWIFAIGGSVTVFLLRYFMGSPMNLGNTIISVVAAMLVGLLIACLAHIKRTTGYSAIFRN